MGIFVQTAQGRHGFATPWYDNFYEENTLHLPTFANKNDIFCR